MIKTICYTINFIISLFIMSCQTEYRIENGPVTSSGEVNVCFTASTSSSVLPAVGKKSRAVMESEIRRIDVLVLEDGRYAYRAAGTITGFDGTYTTFIARLRSSDASVKFLILANASEALDQGEPIAGDTEEAIRKKLLLPFSERGFSDYLPMYGEIDLPQGLNAAQTVSLPSIQMLRAAGRADVFIVDHAQEVFELMSIQAFHVNDLVQVIPQDWDGGAVHTPSVPSGASTALATTQLPTSGPTWSVEQIYLPESEAVRSAADRKGKAVCLVIGGRYKGGATTYYRIDFNPGGSVSFGQILRNYRYVFNIKNVRSQGWGTPEEAAVNNSTNLTAEIIAWEENTTAMEFDGSHHFGVSARKITLRYSAGSEMNLLVDTDLSSYTMEWANEAGAGDGRPAATLTDARFSVEKSGTIIRIRALDTNCGMNGPLVSYLLLKANRWKILITVTQQGFDEVAGNRFVNVLSFNAGLGNLGSNIITSAAAEARGAGMAGILKNTANFGPSGTVPVAGINLIRADVSASTFNKLPASLFDMVDIVYLHYIENAYFGATDAQTVLNWLDAKPDRVLVVTYDAAAYTSAIKNALNLQVSYSTLSTGNFPLVKNTGNQYFTTSGPFTSAANGYSPIPDGFKFRQYDANYGALDPAAYPDVIPVLNTASLYNGSGILLGVDPARRIVYTGDIDLFGSGGTGAPALTTDSCISNTSGNVNSNGAKLMANLWAWMTEVVLDGSEPRL